MRPFVLHTLLGTKVAPLVFGLHQRQAERGHEHAVNAGRNADIVL